MQEIINCESCSQSWADLTTMPGFESVRLCNRCKRTVHLSTSPEAEYQLQLQDLLVVRDRRQAGRVGIPQACVDDWSTLRPLEELDLGKDIILALNQANAYYIGDVISKTADDWSRLGISDEQLRHINHAFASRGIVLGAEHDEWPR